MNTCMPEQQRTLVYIFARDFSLWVNELIRHAYVEEFPTLWGRGLEDQIVHYDGRTSRWYRYEDDYEALRDFMAHQPLDHRMFDRAGHAQFRKNVDAVRSFMAQYADVSAHPAITLKELTSGFQRMYPYYTFSVFLAGTWRDTFLAIHGKDAELLLDMVYKSRAYSEGLVKEIDLFVRRLLSPLLDAVGFPSLYAKLLRKAEVEQFVASQSLPQRSVLDERARGYVYVKDAIHCPVDFNTFLGEHHLQLKEKFDASDALREFSGTVACRGGVIRAPVKIIFNTEEIKQFRSGAILVTPMTSPEYLSAMKTAAAIITDEGGITSHAAIVSRELGIPCIIGTKIATKVFKDGDMVEVDAEKGIVKKLE